MQRFTPSILALLFTATACSASPQNMHEEAEEEGATTVEADAGTSEDASAEPVEPAFSVEDIRTKLEPLTQPPFGTAAAVAIVHDGRMMVVSRGARFTDGAVVTDATPFNLASVSKPLTASLIVQMASDGVLSLDATVDQVLPGVTLRAPDGTDVTTEVTVLDLLRHRGGLPHQPGNQVDPTTFDNRWDDPELLQKLTADWSIELAYQPGEYHYSNMGYMLLGAIAERVGECRFAACMRTHLTELGAQGTTFSATEVVDTAAHGRVMQDGTEKFYHPSWYGSTYAMPFNGAWSDVASLAAFGVKLDEAESSPEAALHLMTVVPDPSTGNYGLGVIHGNLDGLPVFAHDGSGQGFHSRLLVMPEQDIVFVAVTNGGMETSEGAQQFKNLTNQILGVVLREAL